MSSVTRLHHALPLSPDIVKALGDLDVSIAKAIEVAKAAGLPQEIVVASIHGHAHAQTHLMVTA